MGGAPDIQHAEGSLRYQRRLAAPGEVDGIAQVNRRHDGAPEKPRHEVHVRGAWGGVAVSGISRRSEAEKPRNKVHLRGARVSVEILVPLRA